MTSSVSAHSAIKILSAFRFIINNKLVSIQNSSPRSGVPMVARHDKTRLRQMIRVASPTRFDKMTDVGQTKPLRIAAETSDGVEHDVVMKVSAGQQCSVEGLVAETIGSLLASDLGLPVTEPFLVRLDQVFVSSIGGAGQPIRDRLESSVSVAFGCEHAGSQWRRWEKMDRLAPSQIDLALGVLAFDAFIANFDRSPSNANLLVKGLDWRLIDHEKCFRTSTLIPAYRPWFLGALEGVRKCGEPSEHVFAKLLSKSSSLNFSLVRQNWAALTDVRLAQYDAAMPSEWHGAQNFIDDVLTYLKEVRDKIDLCIIELMRVLK